MEELDLLVRRLRGLSGRSWAQRSRRDTVRALLVELAAIGAPGRDVPELPDHALGDAVAVLGADAWAVDAPRAARLIRAALEATR